MSRNPPPSLDDLAACPESGAALSPHEARALLARLAGLLPTLLAVEFGAERAADSGASPAEIPLQCLKPKDIATLTGLDEPYIQALCRTGKLPAFKTGKYWLIPVSRFREWQEQGGLDGVRTPRLPSPHAQRGETDGPPAAFLRPSRRAPTVRPRRPGTATPAQPSGDPPSWSRSPRVAARRQVRSNLADLNSPGEPRP